MSLSQYGKYPIIANENEVTKGTRKTPRPDIMRQAMGFPKVTGVRQASLGTTAR
jgi:hypothetical protein